MGGAPLSSSNRQTSHLLRRSVRSNKDRLGLMFGKQRSGNATSRHAWSLLLWSVMTSPIRRKRSALLGALFTLSFDAAHALTGNEWQSMNSSWRAGYVAGVLDGWSETASKELMAGNSDSVWMKALSCITARNITYRQVVAITEKYVKEHPEEWDKEASTLVYNGVAGTCGITK
jgi:hypothetical protein